MVGVKEEEGKGKNRGEMVKEGMACQILRFGENLMAPELQ